MVQTPCRHITNQSMCSVMISFKNWYVSPYAEEQIADDVPAMHNTHTHTRTMHSGTITRSVSCALSAHSVSGDNVCMVWSSRHSSLATTECARLQHDQTGASNHHHQHHHQQQQRASYRIHTPRANQQYYVVCIIQTGGWNFTHTCHTNK